MDSFNLSRRNFCKAAAAGTALLSVASSARTAGANDRIRFGVIGCGGMGTGHLSNLVKRRGDDNIQVLAVCDVYQRRLTRARKISGGDGYLDYRRVQAGS
jgi:predicted homoserine dehydrogenase-like protein